jgi:hypothetical protein
MPILRTKLLSAAILALLAPQLWAQARADGNTESEFPLEYLGQSLPQSFYFDMRSVPPLRAWQPGDPISEVPREHWLAPGQMSPFAPTPVNPANPIDPLMAKANQFYGQRTQRDFGTPVFSVAGIAFTGVAPPDTSADVGKNHIVQAVNGSAGARYLVLNKNDGTVVAGPVSLNSLGTGGACATSAGDPVIVYDEMAERWLLTEFSNRAGRTLCVYVSAGSDPTATTWTKYEFQTAAFPDYPHYGVWGNSYLITANENSVSANRPIFAIDRAKLLSAQPAGIVRVNLPNLAGFGFQTWTPADHDGKNNPVPNTLPGIFMRHRDDEAHNAGTNNPTQDFLELVQLTVDWTVPTPVGSATPIQRIPIAEFSSNLNGLTAFEAFPQPNAQRLDPLREPIMRRVAYRRFPGYETLLGNLVTDVDGADTGGIRWFELRRTGGAAGTWTLFQEGTHALTDEGGPIDRWMAGSAMDKFGNIAMSYSVVRQSPALAAGLRYAGRLATDPLGTLTTAENTIVNGVGSQGFDRWGDYAQLGTDPEDQCTFVATGQYVGANNSWQSQIAKFRFDQCAAPTYETTISSTGQSICAAFSSSAAPIALNYTVLNGFTGSVNVAFSGALPTGLAGNLSASSVSPPTTITALFGVNPGIVAGENIATIRSTGTGPNGPIIRDNQVTFTVFTQAPSAPTLSAPANNAVGTSLTPVLTWAAAPQTDTYLVQLATDAAFSNVIAQTVTTATSFTPPALSGATRYFWRAISRNACPTSTSPIELGRDGFEDPSSGAASSVVNSFTTATP